MQRYGAAVVLLSQTIYIIGGEDEGGRQLQSVEKFDTLEKSVNQGQHILVPLVSSFFIPILMRRKRICSSIQRPLHRQQSTVAKLLYVEQDRRMAKTRRCVYRRAPVQFKAGTHFTITKWSSKGRLKHNHPFLEAPTALQGLTCRINQKLRQRVGFCIVLWTFGFHLESTRILKQKLVRNGLSTFLPRVQTALCSGQLWSFTYVVTYVIYSRA